jgi:SecD/SecF fusion protein
LFGGDGVAGFAFALFVGIFVGTYSSIFIASPLVADTSKDTSAFAIKEDEEDFRGEDLATTTATEPVK